MNSSHQYSISFQKHWCHHCQLEETRRIEGFTQTEVLCNRCSNAMERVLPYQPHPKNFKPYVVPRERTTHFRIFIFMPMFETEQANQGLTENQLQSLRREINNEERQCYICQEEFNQGEELIALNCNHGYHPNCITTWLKMNNSCPVCRQPCQ